MNESLTLRETEIAETRNRLAGTIDRIQDKLTVSGIVDEVMGSSSVPGFERAYDNALGAVRRNPVPVLIVAAGIGWLLHRIGRREAAARARLAADIVDVPVINDGRARIYDPDLPTSHPAGLADRERLRGAGLNPSI
jgi:hypothetical protein